jgi:hypothetical protein
MSDSDNPYSSPQNPVIPNESAASTGAILTETMLGFLKGASPWLRFIGILGYIGSAFMALAGISFVAFFPLMTGLMDALPGFDEISSVFGGIGALFGVIYGGYFLGAAALAFFPAKFTYNFGAKISTYLRSGAEKDLELALRNNKSLWKFNGIIYVIALAFVPVLTVIGIIAAVVSAFA